ncbi:MAG: hypothetical protein H7039_22840 [Bryobacteraceae bacterium]|nr:hypothetical protein [Bryobacteraceae bacterium]
MTRWLPYLFVFCVLCACTRAGENKEAVKEAVVQHLSTNAALDVSQLKVDVTDVQFKGGEATAQVAIQPKTAPDQGMQMTYTLVRRGERWEVKGKGAGHSGAPQSGSSGADGGAATEPKGALGDAPAGGGELPAGHPPVNPPAPGAKK